MVKIVTDSVASIPAEVVRERDIEVVSLFVNRDGREYREADMDVDAFYEDIADMIDNPPTSSQPLAACDGDDFRKGGAGGR